MCTHDKTNINNQNDEHLKLTTENFQKKINEISDEELAQLNPLADIIVASLLKGE